MSFIFPVFTAPEPPIQKWYSPEDASFEEQALESTNPEAVVARHFMTKQQASYCASRNYGSTVMVGQVVFASHSLGLVNVNLRQGERSPVQDDRYALSRPPFGFMQSLDRAQGPVSISLLEFR